VIGDPWDAAAVIEGTLEDIEDQLESLLAIVRSAKDHAPPDADRDTRQPAASPQ
jgi:hypothetical protein